MDYPLDLRFKLIALAPQLSITDAAGQLLFYVKQKAFKLKEAVTVYADAERTRTVAKISADRVLDISATYRFLDPEGSRFGTLKRYGIKSMWKARYDVVNKAGEEILSLREDNGWIKLIDGMLAQIPVAGLLSGYVFHPSYTLSRPDGTAVLHVKKRAAFLESRFRVERLAGMNEAEEAMGIMSIMMMTLLERGRG